jgi:hypothetical protein
LIQNFKNLSLGFDDEPFLPRWIRIQTTKINADPDPQL